MSRASSVAVTAALLGLLGGLIGLIWTGDWRVGATGGVLFLFGLVIGGVLNAPAVKTRAAEIRREQQS